MMIRTALVLTLVGSPIATTPAATAPSTEQTLAITCPTMTANLVLSDYGGTSTVQMCVRAEGLIISGGSVYINAYGDGIFRNGFE